MRPKGWRGGGALPKIPTAKDYVLPFNGKVWKKVGLMGKQANS